MMAKVVILSGAGLSAESGISTFRDSNGLWEEYDVDTICSYDSLEKNENLTLEFYNKRRADLKDKQPNHAHKTIAKLKKKYPNDIAIITQNVDDLFRKAGLLQKDVIYLHGHLTELRCRKCGEETYIEYEEQGEITHRLCPQCGGKLRPNVVFFGEAAPQYELLNYHLHSCELLIVIGTSGNVLDVNTMASSTNISILNNLESNWVINEENFSRVIYKEATKAIDEIKEIVEDVLWLNRHTVAEYKKTPYIDKITLAKEAIKDADAILITAGAGMGVDSGLPDFRGNEGLWTAYPPIKKLGYDFKQMESSSLFRTNPNLAWGFYGHRMNLYRNTEPNIGFSLLKDLVNSKKNNYFIFTSNVDGHFQKAGFSEDKIYEIHGSINYLQCIDNCVNRLVKNNLRNIDVNMETLETEMTPVCKDCSKSIMPNILMFGDGVFNETIVNQQNDRFKKWLVSLKDSKIVILEIGAGRTIPTIRNFNDGYSKKNDNVKLIRINPVEYEVWNDEDIGINGKGLDIIKKLFIY
jgi:NAD-dependent deacetylase